MGTEAQMLPADTKRRRRRGEERDSANRELES